MIKSFVVKYPGPLPPTRCTRTPGGKFRTGSGAMDALALTRSMFCTQGLEVGLETDSGDVPLIVAGELVPEGAAAVLGELSAEECERGQMIAALFGASARRTGAAAPESAPATVDDGASAGAEL